MEVSDGLGNLTQDFLTKLDRLKNEQRENLRELENLRAAATLHACTEPVHADISQTQHHQLNTEEIENAIRTMWSDFNLSEKLRHTQLPQDIHRESDLRYATAKVKKSWSPKITVPEPFSMTMREESDPRPPKHTRASLEVEARRKAKEEEDLLIKNDFKSRPVPPETYYPIYHDVLEQSESRRKLVLDARRAELAKMSKAPSFIEREEKKAREKAEKVRKLKDEEDRLISMLSNSFKARDVDESILAPGAIEDENERQARIQTRSDYLLRSASLPRRMASAPVRKTTQTSEIIPVRSGSAHRKVPDFKKLHEENQKKMEEAKARAEEERKKRPQTAAPNLHTLKRSQQKPEKVYEEPDTMFRASKISFAPSDSAPFKPNDSFSRRKDFIRQTLDLLETELKGEKERIVERKKRQRAAAKSVRKAIPAKANKIRQAERMRELQNEDQEKLKEFREKMDEIYAKVEKRPLLFTR